MAASLRMYGANGLNQAFEYDGTSLVGVSVPTSIATDNRPIKIDAHRDHLFLAFRGGSVIHSSIGNPHEYDALTGAAEFNVGDEITGFLSSVSGALTIFCANRISVLRGDDYENWVLDSLTDDAGGYEWSQQNINGPVYFDRAGFRSLSTTEAYGNFNINTFTEAVEPLIREKQEDGVTITASLRCRRKNQYRIFFSDGTGMTVYFGRDSVEVCTFNLGINVEYAHSGEDSSGEEILLIGDDAGMVYELDAGTSFDGSAVAAFARFPFHHFGNPEVNKRFKKAVLSVDGAQSSTIGIAFDYEYADGSEPFSIEQTFSLSLADPFELNGLSGFWGESYFNDFYWSDPVTGRIEAWIDGLGISASLLVVHSATYEEPHTLQSITMQISDRGLAR